MLMVQRKFCKMQIYIEKEANVEKIPEWHLIEFQGRFYKEGTEEVVEKPCFDEYFGDLNFTKKGVPFFVNGHHIMFGRLVKLRRPFAIVHLNSDNEGCEKQYLVKAVIRNKIVFLQRPKPIIPHEVPINNNI